MWCSSGVQVTTIAPRAELAPFVRALTIVEAVAETTRALLPETGVLLGLRYRGASHLRDGERATRVPDASLTGVRDTVRHMTTAAGSGVVVVAFREGGAAHFIPAPLHPLFGRIVPLDELIPRGEIERARQRLQRAGTSAERIAAVEDLLLARRSATPPDPIVAAAVAAIRESGGMIRIRDLARELGITQDPLEKRFRRAVGASPKQLARIVRLRRAIEARGPEVSLARVAHAAGYYDQSHFIREFRAFTGEAPEAFFAARAYCTA